MVYLGISWRDHIEIIPYHLRSMIHYRSDRFFVLPCLASVCLSRSRCGFDSITSLKISVQRNHKVVRVEVGWRLAGTSPFLISGKPWENIPEMRSSLPAWIEWSYEMICDWRPANCDRMLWHRRFHGFGLDNICIFWVLAWHCMTLREAWWHLHSITYRKINVESTTSPSKCRRTKHSISKNNLQNDPQRK